MNKARGGELVTNVMTHFIYPEIPGFEQAGGLKGPQVDYNDYPEGNMAVAAKYMRLAGYPSGKYTGSKTLQIVGSNESPSAEDAEIVNQTLKNLGFKTKLTLVEDSVMYSKYCGTPAEEIDVCPNVGWVADFGDPQAVLDVAFNGKNIVSTGNNNWGQVNNPEINKAMDAAELVVGVQPRAKAWAAIDRKLVAQAAAIPFDWDKQPNIESKDVAGVGDLWNTGQWDYSYHLVEVDARAGPDAEDDDPLHHPPRALGDPAADPRDRADVRAVPDPAHGRPRTAARRPQREPEGDRRPPRRPRPEQVAARAVLDLHEGTSSCTSTSATATTQTPPCAA